LRITGWNGGRPLRRVGLCVITAARAVPEGFVTLASVVAATERRAVSPSSSDLDVQ